MAEAKGEGKSGGDDIAEARKQALRESDSSLSDLGSDDGSDDGGSKRGGPKLTFYQQIRRAISKASKTMGQGFVDYGPPYEDDPLRESLVSVCYEANPNIIKVHNLLNDRANPNEQDPEDFYMSAMHYCARNGNYLVMRMLRRAGGSVNLINEFGQSPLHLCCMQVSTKDLVVSQHKMFLWLIREGSDIHHRDRAGFEPLDYCAMNNDLEKVKVLLECGAKVRRTNFDLKAERKSVLKQVSDPDVWRVLNEALQIEEAAFQEAEGRRQAAKEERLADERAIKNLMNLKKKKETKVANAKKAAEYDKLVAKLDARKKNIAQSMEALTHSKKAAAAAFGEYERDDQGNWTWVAKDRSETAEAAARNVYAAAVKTMGRLQERNRLELYQERWAKMGGDEAGALELDWRRSAPFDQEDDSDDDSDEAAERRAKKKASEIATSKAAALEASDADLAAELEEEEEDAALGVEDGDDVEDLLAGIGQGTPVGTPRGAGTPVGTPRSARPNSPQTGGGLAGGKPVNPALLRLKKL